MGERTVNHQRAGDRNLSNSQPSTQQRSASQRSSIPQLELVTQDELDSISKYMKGRLTITRLNAAIAEINHLLYKKYTLMNKAMSKMSDQQVKKVKAYRQQENEETRGYYFFTDQDLRDCPKLKLDATGKSILNVLRHLSRIKELGGSS